MPAGSYAENLLLQYLLLGSTATRVTTWTYGLSLGSPSQASLSEVGAGSGYTRKEVFGAFALSGSTVNNIGAVGFGPFSSVATISGVFMVSGGNLLLYGTLSPVTAVAVGSSAQFASAALKITLS